MKHESIIASLQAKLREQAVAAGACGDPDPLGSYSKTFAALREQHGLEHHTPRELVAHGVSKVYPTLIRRVRERLLKSLDAEVVDALCAPHQWRLRADYCSGSAYAQSVTQLVAALRFMYADRVIDLFGQTVWLNSARAAVQTKAICFVQECLQLCSTDKQIQMADFILDKMSVIRRGGAAVVLQPVPDQNCASSEIRVHLMDCLRHYDALQGRELVFHEALMPLLKEVIHLGARPIFEALLQGHLPAESQQAWAMTYDVIRSGGCPGVYYWEDWERVLGGEQHDAARILSLLKLSMERVLRLTQTETGGALSDDLEHAPQLEKQRVLLRERSRQPFWLAEEAHVFGEPKPVDPTLKATNPSLLLDCLLNDFVRGVPEVVAWFKDVTEWQELSRLSWELNPWAGNHSVRLVTDGHSLQAVLEEKGEDSDSSSDSDWCRVIRDETPPVVLTEPAEQWHLVMRMSQLPKPEQGVIYLRVPADAHINLQACALAPNVSLVLIGENTLAVPAALPTEPGQVILVGLRYEQCTPPDHFRAVELMTPEQFRQRFEGRRLAEGEPAIDAKRYVFSAPVSLRGVNRLFRNESHLLACSQLTDLSTSWFQVLMWCLNNPGSWDHEEYFEWPRLRRSHPTLSALTVTENIKTDYRFPPEYPIPLAAIRRASPAPRFVSGEFGGHLRANDWVREGYPVLTIDHWRSLWSRGLGSVECRLFFIRNTISPNVTYRIRDDAKKPVWLIVLTLGLCLLVYRIQHSMRLRVLERLRPHLAASRVEELGLIFNRYRWRPISTVIQNYLHHQLSHLPCIQQLTAAGRALFLGSRPESQAEYLPLFGHRRHLARFVRQHYRGSAREKTRRVDQMARTLTESLQQWDGISSDAEKQAWYRRMEPFMMGIISVSYRKGLHYPALVKRLGYAENFLFLGALFRLGGLLRRQDNALRASEAPYPHPLTKFRRFGFGYQHALRSYYHGTLSRPEESLAINAFLKWLPGLYHHRLFRDIRAEAEAPAVAPDESERPPTPRTPLLLTDAAAPITAI